MSQVTSHDGTTIAYARAGSGPALIVVDGALCSRSFGPSAKLSARLAPRFTVYTYDRLQSAPSTTISAGPLPVRA